MADVSRILKLLVPSLDTVSGWWILIEYSAKSSLHFYHRFSLYEPFNTLFSTALKYCNCNFLFYFENSNMLTTMEQLITVVGYKKYLKMPALKLAIVDFSTTLGNTYIKL
jgi:hypothetical protein